MSAMEPSAANQPPASEPARTDATATGSTEKPYGDRYFKPVITPGLAKGPLLPEWLSSRLSRLFNRITPSH